MSWPGQLRLRCPLWCDPSSASLFGATPDLWRQENNDGRDFRNESVCDTCNYWEKDDIVITVVVENTKLHLFVVLLRLLFVGYRVPILVRLSVNLSIPENPMNALLMISDVWAWATIHSLLWLVRWHQSCFVISWKWNWTGLWLWCGLIPITLHVSVHIWEFDFHMLAIMRYDQIKPLLEQERRKSRIFLLEL